MTKRKMSTQRVNPILHPTIHIIRGGHLDFVEDVRTTDGTLVKIIATLQTRPKMSTGDEDHNVASFFNADHTKDISKFLADFRNRLCEWFGRQWFHILRGCIFGVRGIFRQQALYPCEHAMTT